MRKAFIQTIFSPPSYNPEIRHKILRLLNTNLLKSSPIIIINAGFLVYILWGPAQAVLLSIWLLSVLLITLGRDMQAYLYFKDDKNKEYAQWYRRYTLGVILSATAWAIIPTFFFSEAEAIHNFFIAFVILGIASGSSATLAGDLKLSRIYHFFLLIPLLVQFFIHSGALYTTAGFMSIFYLVLVSVTSKSFHDNVVDSLRHQARVSEVQDELNEHEKRLSMMFKQAPTGIFYYDNDLIIIDCNIKLEEIMHASRKQLVGLSLNKIPDPRPLNAMRNALKQKIPTLYEGPYRSKVAGLDLIVKIQMTPLIDKDGSVHGGICMMEDKTSEYHALKEAEFLSLHDALTALPNRKLLKERMQQTIMEQKRQHTYAALLFLDLDHFKQINDSLGHNIGDKILIETTHRLQDTLRKSDTLSRLGGDEFVILLPHLAKDERQAIHHAYEVAQKIHTSMNEVFNIDEHALFSSTSIGITLFDNTLTESGEILRRADMAMYQSKSSGRKRTSFYDAKMDQQLQVYVERKKSLHYAIERNEFSIYFQPILKIQEEKTVAAEVLLRWHHDGKMIPTLELISVAEESSLIHEIGRWVFVETCQQLQVWMQKDLFNLEYVTINISARQLLETGFSDFVLSTLEQYGLKHQHIKLEITETALISNFEKAKEVIDTLNEIGIDFIIDDFGTGYSSLSYLKMLPFSALKIDKSFVKDILTNPEDEKLIRAIIHTAEQFNYQIIAEGIEEEEQRTLLKKINPNIYYQGFLISKPVSAEAFEVYLNT